MMFECQIRAAVWAPGISRAHVTICKLQAAMLKPVTQRTQRLPPMVKAQVQLARRSWSYAARFVLLRGQQS
jgi:hypothetical protein